ncbi:hypothetical protein, variant 2 [Aphanomyces astaci]|nr:hypothetical protein, variant 1 [Aphanomyces astaci]XP_009845924.1 hypothetical protein, variant 2 [Aphanomyces astaci]ETV64599.1 hypothetical protein, variant 1 [Aphanomyces astaci]ETV64600.1 hypothetical protein, variant 2 [Aphanomyces astaci]|eukprot:XP_009845923.1 hypothetical protein, variant 1 [Aphanomyces astaci]
MDMSPLPPPIPARRQAQAAIPDELDSSEESSDAASPPPKKLKQQLKKRDRRSAGAVIGDAIAKLVDVEASKACHNSDPHKRVTTAIECVLDNYSHVDADHIAKLADMMGTGYSATIFSALGGEARDAWIAKSIHWSS